MHRGSKIKNHREENMPVTSVPFSALDQDLPSRTRWRSRSRSLGCGLIDFDPTSRSSHGFPSFLLGVRLAVALRLPARGFRALAPAPVEGSLVDSSPGGWAETKMAKIGISLSKLGTREIKLSNAYIQTNEV
jgi:hypothetical protein